MESRLSIKILKERAKGEAKKAIDNCIIKSENQIKNLKKRNEKKLSEKPELKESIMKEEEDLINKNKKEVEDTKKKAQENPNLFLRLGQGSNKIFTLLADKVDDTLYI